MRCCVMGRERVSGDYTESWWQLYTSPVKIDRPRATSNSTDDRVGFTVDWLRIRRGFMTCAMADGSDHLPSSTIFLPLFTPSSSSYILLPTSLPTDSSIPNHPLVLPSALLLLVLLTSSCCCPFLWLIDLFYWCLSGLSAPCLWSSLILWSTSSWLTPDKCWLLGPFLDMNSSRLSSSLTIHFCIPHWLGLYNEFVRYSWSVSADVLDWLLAPQLLTF